MSKLEIIKGKIFQTNELEANLNIWRLLEKKIVFTVRKEEIPPVTSDGMANLGGGVYLNCYSYNDCPSCRPHTAPPATCLFQCECFMEVYYPSKDVTEFETPQGNYRGSDLR
jgi:hypothetical protein